MKAIPAEILGTEIGELTCRARRRNKKTPCAGQGAMLTLKKDAAIAVPYLADFSAGVGTLRERSLS